jgi:predicted RNA-binding Zn ribbon-like protein
VVRDRRVSLPVGALRFDAGSLALNLVATVGRRYGESLERLDSVPRLRDWLAGVGLPDIRVSEDDLAASRELREHLEILFRSAVTSKRPPRLSVEHVNAVGALASPALRTSGSRLALATSSGSGFDSLRALIAQDAIRTLTGNERHDLRVCAADDCRMLYLSRGRRDRRWCSSGRCGNRSRVAAHRARAAGRRGARR